MTLEQILLRIEGDDLSEWKAKIGYDVPPVWVYKGESVDGVPDWRVQDWGGHGWIEREIGWYLQRGDWDNYEDLVRIAKAMDAADKALQATLMEKQ